jgi:ATP-dependent RNA helicase DeaD
VENLTFIDLDIDSNVLQAIAEMGFTEPTEIQEKAIPILSETNKDFIGQAQTGTGKTAAFVIPLLEKIDAGKTHVQALVLAPTRELAMQVEAETKKLAKYTGVRTACVYGGAAYDRQIRALKKDKPQIVVGTPGRVIDMMNKDILRIDRANFCVLDEADEMLNMGFFEDVQTILGSLQDDRQLIMFSATMPKPIIQLVSDTFNEYELVKIKKKSLSNDDIEQKYFIVDERYFTEALARLIENEPETYGLVFCRTKAETKQVGEELQTRGQYVEILHGDMVQADRTYAMNRFKAKKVNIMVCTDVAARGIDVNNLTHVFNYGLPQDNESYVHRIGRTGRAGMKGCAYTIVSPKSSFIIRKIERHINKQIDRAKLPTVDELKANVVKKGIDHLETVLEKISTRTNHMTKEEFFHVFSARYGKLNKDELLKLLFTLKFKDTFKHYNGLPDIEKVARHDGPRKSRKGGKSNSHFAAKRRRRGRPERSVDVVRKPSKKKFKKRK